MRSKLLKFVGFFFFPVLGVSAFSPAAASTLQEVRTWSASQTSRVVLELSAQTPYKFFIVDNPRRAVIDLTKTELAAGLRAPQAEGLVAGIRFGEQGGGTLRVVVDLVGAAPARVLEVAADGTRGQRIVLDIGSATGSEAAVPTPPKAAAPIKPKHAPSARDREVVVAIDAGHGGVDPGAIGRRGTREKDVVLQISRDLAARINREPGMRAVLTRNGDYFLSLRQRIMKARAANADMFVSVHADSVRNSEVSGASVYVLSEKGASDEQARWLAERENAADLAGGISLEDKDQTLRSVLLDLSQSASISASMDAAEKVLRTLNEVATVRKPRVQQAGFVVLKSPDIPSMLVETAFISNLDDERLLGRDAHRAKLADAIFRGVKAYFSAYPPEGSRFARKAAGSAGTVAQNID